MYTRALLFVAVLVCVYAKPPIDETTRLARVILESKLYPRITNETDARHFAVLLQKQFDMYVKTSAKWTPSVKANEFPCTLTGRSNPTPTLATRLLPGDIDAVASVGDSLVAGFGALAGSILGVFTEYRGHSFANGAAEDFSDFITMPAILKLYNPNLKGYSTGTGGADSNNAKLNLAVSGARSYDLIAQINKLETRMASMGVTPANWKLITVFVGGNDLCDFCGDTNKNSADNYQRHIEAALDLIKEKFPRVFVNLVSPPDVTLLGQVNTGFCSLLHSYECGCAKDAGTHGAHRTYTLKLAETVSKAKYLDKPDFHVALQPFLSDLVLPRVGGQPDDSYFAPDCFHFSGKAHEAAAVALWNNMCENGEKLNTWVPGEPLECPNIYLS